MSFAGEHTKSSQELVPDLLQQASYTTLDKGALATGDYTDRKSRFIAQLVHVESEAEADAHLAEVRAKHHDARHNVCAWVLADGRERCSDDGEPSRTAGLPVLDVLRGAGLKDVCCVVTRYFGGTLLGPGGLVRAYTAATQEALEAARKENVLASMSQITPVTIQLPYALYDRVVRLVADHGGKVHDSLFTEDIQLIVHFLSGGEAAFIEALTELVAGEELASVGKSFFGAF